MSKKITKHHAKWSFNLNEDVEKSKKLTRSQLDTYSLIYGFYKSKLKCEISFKGISLQCGFVNSTAEIAVKRLEELGWITVEHGARPEGGARNECNIYTIKRFPNLPKPKPKPRKVMTAEQKNAAFLQAGKNAGVDPVEVKKVIIKTKLSADFEAFQCKYEHVKDKNKLLAYHQELESLNNRANRL